MPNPANPTAKQKLILVVEDDKHTNELFSSTIRMAGFEVVSCYSAEDALMEVGKRLPDLIVLDLLLPKMDGWELCRALRQEGTETRKIPIVIASVISHHDVEKSSESMGILSFFNKPFEPARLVAELKRIFTAI